MRILHLGNDFGYSLIDALVALFLCSIALIAIFSFMSGTVKKVGMDSQKLNSLLNARNEKVHEYFTDAEK